jgi:hypothetical protein
MFVLPEVHDQKLNHMQYRTMDFLLMLIFAGGVAVK